MQIAVFSDTHGNYTGALQALERLGTVDIVIHLGDLVDDAEIIAAAISMPLIRVPGNCDPAAQLPHEQIRNCAGKRLFICHGHRYSVKSGVERLCQEGKRNNADVILFGHTHQPLIANTGHCVLVNPGALTPTCHNPTCALITIKGNDVSADIIPLPAASGI